MYYNIKKNLDPMNICVGIYIVSTFLIAHIGAQPFSPNGANLIDLLWSRLPTTPGNHTENIKKSKQAMKDAAANGITHVRFAGASYLGRNMKIWHDVKTRDKYWEIMDSIYIDAKGLNIYLTPSIFFDTWVFPDLCNESMGLLVNRNVDSCTRTTLKSYISQFISRYYNNLTTVTSSNKYLNPLLSSNNSNNTDADGASQRYYYLLEMTNEFDLQYDIEMNGRTAAGKVRTSADNVSHKDGIQFTIDFASWVRAALVNANSSTDIVKLTSGHAIPRPCGGNCGDSWDEISQQEFLHYIRDIHQSMDVVCIHTYITKGMTRKTWNPPILRNTSTAIINIIADYVTNVLRKDLWIGEYGLNVEDRYYLQPPKRTKELMPYFNFFQNIVNLCSSSMHSSNSNKIFSTIWVWEFNTNHLNNITLGIWPGRDNVMINAIKKSNKK